MVWHIRQTLNCRHYSITTRHKLIKYTTDVIHYSDISCCIVTIYHLRDRPFNLKGGLWFFVSFRNLFSDNTSVRIYIFFCRAMREFFFQHLTLGYMTKTLNQIIFFFLHQNQNIFLEKNHNPPPSS